MKPSARPKIRWIADILEPAKAQAFLELVKIIRQQPDHENLMIRDEEGDILGCLSLPECHASPDDPPTDPEFLKELQRRLENPEPAILIDEEGIDLDDLLFGDKDPE